MLINFPSPLFFRDYSNVLPNYYFSIELLSVNFNLLMIEVFPLEEIKEIRNDLI